MLIRLYDCTNFIIAVITYISLKHNIGCCTIRTLDNFLANLSHSFLAKLLFFYLFDQLTQIVSNFHLDSPIMVKSMFLFPLILMCVNILYFLLKKSSSYIPSATSFLHYCALYVNQSCQSPSLSNLNEILFST